MKPVVAIAPTNIALIKYWGKKEKDPLIPYTSSLSVTLRDVTTTTTLSQGHFAFQLNGKKAGLEETDRVLAVLKAFNKKDVIIDSINHFPTAAGIASSASGFAALTVGLNAFFKTQLPLQTLARISRIGSGSACRSLLEGFVLWEKEGPISQLNYPADDLRMLIAVIDDQKKSVSSRAGMEQSVKTSPIFNTWVSDSEKDLSNMLKAIRDRSFHKIGAIAEVNSERLYAVMRTTVPIIDYRSEETHRLTALIPQLRAEGIAVYFTLDAGANVKLLTLEKDILRLEKALVQHGFKRLIKSRIGGQAHVE